MARLILVAVLSLCFLNPTNTKEVPPFIFPHLDQVTVSLWLALDAKNMDKASALIYELEDSWQAERPMVEQFLENYYAPIQLLPMVDNIVSYFRPALVKKDEAALKRLSARFMREFRFIRSYFRQDYYPLDALWDAYPIYLEIEYATNDAALGLFEWQELECLFDEFSCMIGDYEQLATANLPQYVPNVNKAKHEAAMIGIRQCLTDFRAALATGYRTELVWPCDQIGESLRLILSCYALPTTNL